MDQHIGWTQGNATDTAPFFISFAATTFDATVTAPRSVWWNEITAADPNGILPMWRHGRSWITGASQTFNAQEAIGAVSQDGRFFSFTSDWMGTLGSDAGGSTCTVGTNCRNDVFVMNLRFGGVSVPNAPTGLTNTIHH